MGAGDEAAPRCSACGARVDGGSAGCERLFDAQLATDFSDFRYGRSHRLVVDTYSLQHHEKYMKSAKSFAAHLTGLCAAMDHETPREILAALQAWLNGKVPLEKPARLPAPGQRGALTILHLDTASGPADHARCVRQWAESAWAAWAEHHALARQWIKIAMDNG